MFEFEETADELYDHAPCGYLTTRLDGTIVRVNETLLGWTGLDRAEVIGRVRFQDLLTVAGRIYHETHLAPLLQMQGFVDEIALELTRKDRAPMPVLIGAVQKRHEDGQPLFNRVTVFNATDRRKYERELLLERRRAERAEKAKADLLAMIGHDIRTPLNSIGGAVQLLERLSPTDQQSKYLRILRSSSATLLSLANQILEFSRLEARQAVLDEAPFDVRAMLSQTVDALLGRAEDKGISLFQEIDPQLPELLVGDATRIQQVLANLLGNAVKFTASGSVTAAVRLVALEEKIALVAFSVADTGIGIAADRLAAVFEEFAQADAEIGRKYGGTGLGLTISRRLVELHGGKLTVESEVDKGSLFRFELRLGVGARR
ncbi:MAG: PAS domain-containing protein [Myxococcales bacterium]|nr:PAS domain-containing protein [Myxococcales bacterium]